VGRDVELLDERIDDTREVVNVALDNQRNRCGPIPSYCLHGYYKIFGPTAIEVVN
jgi:hypothetical protein